MLDSYCLLRNDKRACLYNIHALVGPDDCVDAFQAFDTVFVFKACIGGTKSAEPFSGSLFGQKEAIKATDEAALVAASIYEQGPELLLLHVEVNQCLVMTEIKSTRFEYSPSGQWIQIGDYKWVNIAAIASISIKHISGTDVITNHFLELTLLNSNKVKSPYMTLPEATAFAESIVGRKKSKQE